MRKMLFLALICTVLFNACSKDECDLVNIEEVALSSCETSSVIENVATLSISTLVSNDCYEELNSIPSVISQKMNKDELNVWKLVSSQFYVNYDVIESKYYKNHKQAFLNNLINMYKRAKANKEEPAHVMFISERNTVLNNRDLSVCNYSDTTTVGGNGSFDNDSTDISEVNKEAWFKSDLASYTLASTEILLVLRGHVRITGTYKKPIYSWDSLNSTFEVADASMVGSQYPISYIGSLNTDVCGNEVHVYGDGTLTYRYSSMNIHPNYIFGFALE